MKAIRTLHIATALLVVLPILLAQICAAAQPMVAGQTSATTNFGATFPWFFQSVFPVVGLVAAVAFTQLLHRRRVLELKVIPVDRS